jgi:IS5 family transposase
VAVEPDTGIITDCALTKASGPDTHDAAVAAQLLADEDEQVTVLGDSAYGSGDFRAHLAAAKHVDRVKSAPVRPAVAEGFTIDDFIVDHTARGYATFGVACRSCPLRARCTTSATGKSLKIRPHDALQRAARQRSRELNWLNEYRQHRPMVERTIAWLTRNNRKVRYRGVTRNEHWLHHRAAAVNLRRLITLGLTHTSAGWAIA